jgi:hypothetical protein
MTDRIQLVRIAGPTDVLRALPKVPGLDVHTHGTRQLGEDTWEVSARATDEALAEVRRRGLAVTMVMDADEFDAHSAKVLGQVPEREPPEDEA